MGLIRSEKFGYKTSNKNVLGIRVTCQAGAIEDTIILIFFIGFSFSFVYFAFFGQTPVVRSRAASKTMCECVNVYYAASLKRCTAPVCPSVCLSVPCLRLYRNKKVV